MHLTLSPLIKVHASIIHLDIYPWETEECPFVSIGLTPAPFDIWHPSPSLQLDVYFPTDMGPVQVHMSILYTMFCPQIACGAPASWSAPAL